MQRKEFEILAGTIRTDIFEMARRLLGNDDEADDIAQDTLLKLWCMRERLDEYRSVKALAMVVARRLCIDRLRYTKAISITGITPAEWNESPEDIVMQHEQREEIERIISSLPDGQQTVLRMKHIDGMETAEIARVLGSSEVTVRVALSRARQRIRDMFLTKKR